MAIRCVIGVDLGGTNVRAAAVSESGSFVGPRVEMPSLAEHGASETIQALAEAIGQASQGASLEPDAIGIAIPGSVDDERGIVLWSPNFGVERDGVFDYWQNVPIRDPLARLVAKPICMGNDANLAALGEYQFGTGNNDAHCLVMFTLGTGIGSGVILGSNSVQGGSDRPLMLLGGNRLGVELGHTMVQFNGLDSTAGGYGSLEAYCQRDAIVRRAQYKLIRGRASWLREATGNDATKVTPSLLSQGADRGDEVCIETLAEIGTFLGVGIGSAINTFAPSVVAIGGQIAKAGDWIIEPARESARSVAIPSLFGDCRIQQASLIDDAGILGAAALAFQSLPSGRKVS